MKRTTKRRFYVRKTKKLLGVGPWLYEVRRHETVGSFTSDCLTREFARWIAAALNAHAEREKGKKK